jgi:hypothetical protein
VAERRVLVNEVSRRWLCGEINAAEYFSAAHAAGLEAARRAVAERLNGGPPSRGGWAQRVSRLLAGKNVVPWPDRHVP